MLFEAFDDILSVEEASAALKWEKMPFTSCCSIRKSEDSKMAGSGVSQKLNSPSMSERQAKYKKLARVHMHPC